MKKSIIEEYPLGIASILMFVLFVLFTAFIGVDTMKVLMESLFKIAVLVYLVWSGVKISQLKNRITKLENTVIDLKKKSN